jgi:hypothetical protein
MLNPLNLTELSSESETESRLLCFSLVLFEQLNMPQFLALEFFSLVNGSNKFYSVYNYLLELQDVHTGAIHSHSQGVSGCYTDSYTVYRVVHCYLIRLYI